MLKMCFHFASNMQLSKGVIIKKTWISINIISHIPPFMPDNLFTFYLQSSLKTCSSSKEINMGVKNARY